MKSTQEGLETVAQGWLHGIERGLLHKRALKRPPQGITIELTQRCNLSCKMCSYWKRPKDGLAHEKILSLLDEVRALGATGFYNCGTEPFMREDTPEILAYAERIGFREIPMVSNGALLNKGRRLEKLEKLKSLNIVISLDGPREVHDGLRGKGVYDEAVEALREMRRRGIRCSISSVIMRQTVDSLKEIVDLAAGLGIPVIALQPYARFISGPDNDHSSFEFLPEEEESLRKKLGDILDHAKSKNIRVYTENMMSLVPSFLARGTRPMPADGCLSPAKTFVVGISGETYPCVRWRGKSMGSVHDKTVPEIWYGAIHRELTGMAMDRKCPGCLSGCADMESFNSSLRNGSHAVKMVLKSLIGR